VGSLSPLFFTDGLLDLVEGPSVCLRLVLEEAGPSSIVPEDVGEEVTKLGTDWQYAYW